MAEIKMDISEYEVMRENKQLLEKSLERERELHEQIKKLSDEKIKALEDAKMKVVKITKSEVSEYFYTKKRNEQIWDELINIVRNYQNNREFLVERFLKSCFTKTKTYSTPYEEITTHGLDDIKDEIRKDLKDKMDKDTISKIETANDILSKNNKLIEENKTLRDENSYLKENNKKLIGQYDALIDNLSIIEKIKEILKNGYSFWNKGEILNKVIELIKKYN